jgi:hypothetical protein
MGSKKCTLTGLGKEDGIVSTLILHKTRRHVHQIATEAVTGMLSARCTDGGVKLKGDTLLIRCGAPLSAKQVCMCWIGVGKIQKLAKRDTEIAELLQKLWFCANERAGKVAYCPRSTCIASSGFILESESVRTVVCPRCSEKWCRDCNEDHTGECGGGDVIDVQRCPECKEGCWKDAGCDHMQCKCGCYFCYVCGMKITGKYNYHVKYSPEHGTYVCPQRLDNADVVKSVKPIKLPADEELYGEILLDEMDENLNTVPEWTGAHYSDVWNTFKDNKIVGSESENEFDDLNELAGGQTVDMYNLRWRGSTGGIVLH